MNQMKTLNGYEITDAKAREQITQLIENENNYVTKDTLFEEVILLSCGTATTNID